MAINVPAIALARSVVAPDNREVLWEDTSNMNLPFYERIKSYDSNSGQWRMVTQLPLELLNELRKVDGDGSGLDANFLQGRTVNDIIQLAKDGSFTLPNGFIFIGNTLGNAVARAVSGDATLNNIGTLSLIASGVTAGTYDLASLTIDAKGRITSASSYTITVNDIPELPQSKITNLTTDLSARELLANKENSVINTSTTKYPTVNLLKIGLDTKEPTITAGTTGQYYRGDKTFQTLDKTAVGLGNVDNTSDADKPISSATALEFTNVYNEVSTKANNYVDIANIISGYILTDTDAGKLITNSGINVRTLVIPSSLNLPNNTIFIKGRIAIQPNAGVNIELPDTTIITSPTQFTCVADEVYILHKSAFTGDDYILVSVKKSENIGTNDLIITDTIRELQVATGGTFQIVTNDPNNSTLFKVGENSNERFSEIELNSITYDVTTAEPNPTNNGAGIITRINPNEYELESRSDIGNVGTKRSRIYTSPGEVILEKTNAGKLTLNSLGASNTFEDLRATKKGLEYFADYSTNFSVRSLVDKGYVDAGLSTKIGAVIEDTTPQLGGDLDLNGNDINGTGNVDITGNVIANIVKLKGGTGTQGEMSWSTDEETVKLIMDGTTLYMGQDTFVHVRNNTASIITKGTAVYATGTLGASGRITVAPMIANGTIAGRLFIGLAAEDIAIGADGQVCSYGKIRGINTTAYNDGDVLWLSPTIAGQLTATEPTAPNLKIATAFVIHDATNGTLMVRAEQGNDLHLDQRVQVSGLTNNDVLTWNNANQRWQNAQPTSTNIYSNNGTIGSGRVATLTDTLSFAGGRVSFDTTTNGILLPRLTTAQMNGISSPATNLLVYNTDLNGIYRYNGSSWVALAVGYGIVGVYSGSGNGTPTFFADLQSALETCKASGGYFTVKLYSNITITSSILIDYTGSGVGGAYLFRQLTIDFNGFSITNNQTDSSHCFDLRLSNSSSVYQEVRFLNGSVFRNNGTGTHRALKCDTAGRFGTVQMSKMFWYCQNSGCVVINLSPLSTAQGVDRVCDFGGSTIVSQTGFGLFIDNGSTHVKNFDVIVNGSDYGVGANSGNLSYFTAENTSTGRAVSLSGTVIARYFSAFSNSGTALFINTGTATNFTCNSVTGRGIDADIANCTIDNFTSITGDNRALKVLGSFDNNSNFSNGKCINNGATVCVELQNFGSANNIEAINNGSGRGLDVLSNQGSRTEVTNCRGTSIGGIGGAISVAAAGSVANVDNCYFISHWNNSGGHALSITSTTGSIILTKSHMKVRNASANAIHATAPRTINSRYCTDNEVATTPVNANVTIVSSRIIS